MRAITGDKKINKLTTVEPRLSGLFLWSQFFHVYLLVVILKTQSRKKPNILSKDC